MERLGIIDLGSNSVRLVIIDINDRGAHHQIENLKETVRLIGGTDEKGYLSEKVMQYAIDTIELFVNFCKARRVDKIIAVATAAIRRAANRQTFIDRLKKETGISFRVLSGEEEARLGYIGTVNSISFSDGLMADLGGGSLKLVSFENRLATNITSQNFGVVSLTRDFELHETPSPENIEKLENFLESAFNRISWLGARDKLVGLGGTFRLLARIYRKTHNYVPDITDGLELKFEDVEKLYRQLSSLSLEERLQIPGMEPARADISVAGAATIYSLMKVSRKKDLVVSTSGIRDGLLYEYLNRYTNDPIVLSVITHQINNLISYHGLGENHLRRVSNLAVTLFDQLQPFHKMSSYDRRLLLIAGLLHELGVVISVDGKDKHTLYMIMNSPIYGLSHRERVMIAYIAASHDDIYLANIDNYTKNGPLEEQDITTISKLSALLQIAHSLDRCNTGIVYQLRTNIQARDIDLHVIAKAKADLEINDAQRKAKYFEQIFGMNLNITNQRSS